ncbi:SRPBCC family protein [Corynebacterium sp. YSMAA1_1_F7]|uniref:SRPBCC family protein n=1 Tax=Corynebacterium sp. YSMAA1_1_F7 TaxID=3383590 RepID=UPI0038CFE9FC
MAAPEISASTTVNASASKVWQRVTDLSAMGQRSPQCKKMILLPRGSSSSNSSAADAGSAAGTAPTPGTVTINFNRQGLLWWPTWAVVTEVEPEKLFEFKIPLNGTRWRFELTPATDGTQTILTEKRLIPDGNTSLVSRVLVAAVLGGEEKFEASLQEGIQQTIRALAREAENF